MSGYDWSRSETAPGWPVFPSHSLFYLPYSAMRLLQTGCVSPWSPRSPLQGLSYCWLAAFGISFCLLHLRLALSAPEGKSLGLAFLGEWHTEQPCYYSLGQPRYQHGASSHPTTFLGDLMALQGVTAEWGLMWLTLKICGDLPCLANKGSEKATSCFKSLKSLLPTEPRQGCGFLCFFCMLFFGAYLEEWGIIPSHGVHPPLYLHSSLSKCLKAFLLFLGVETNFCFLCQCLVTPSHFSTGKMPSIFLICAAVFVFKIV